MQVFVDYCPSIEGSHLPLGDVGSPACITKRKVLSHGISGHTKKVQKINFKYLKPHWTGWNLLLHQQLCDVRCSYDLLLLWHAVYGWVCNTVDVSSPIAYHGGIQGSMFGLQRMQNSMVNARDSRFILVRVLDRDRVIALRPVGVSLCIELIVKCGVQKSRL